MGNDVGYGFAVRLVVIPDDRMRSHAGATRVRRKQASALARSRLSRSRNRRLVHADRCLSDGVAPAARLQNRACDFRRTRLLSDTPFVIRHPDGLAS